MAHLALPVRDTHAVGTILLVVTMLHIELKWAVYQNGESIHVSAQSNAGRLPCAKGGNNAMLCIWMLVGYLQSIQLLPAATLCGQHVQVCTQSARLQHHKSPEKHACLGLRKLDFWDLVQLTAGEGAKKLI